MLFKQQPKEDLPEPTVLSGGCSRGFITLVLEEKHLNHFQMARAGGKVNFISYRDLIKWTIRLYEQPLHGPTIRNEL